MALQMNPRKDVPATAAHALLVDRDADTRRMYMQWLTLDDWHIEEADDGREALAKAISHRPDVIVTETRLPGMTGLELCEVLRRDASTQAIPIVVVTGDGYRGQVEQAKSAGADSVLVKPCLPDTLRAEMRRLLDASAQLRARATNIRGTLADQMKRADQAVARSREVMARYSSLSPRMARVPPRTFSEMVEPPPLVCPSCDRQMIYVRSHFGGVGKTHERWDYFQCPNACGDYQYRVRTRKLRKVT